MKPVERGEVLGLAEYEKVRDAFRARVIEEKKRRRVKLGDRATCVFENHDTALMQIQEMLRTERISREAAVLHEIETYNELVPKDDELSATIFVEIDDKPTREAFLVAAKGLEKRFAVVVDGDRCAGTDDGKTEGADRTAAVHYIKFPLTAGAVRAFKDVAERKRKASELVVELVADHAAYTASVRLPPEVVLSLAEDFVG